MKKTLYILNFVILTLIFNSYIFAQAKSETKEIKGKENTYKCEVYKREYDSKKKSITAFYVNSKYDMEKIHNERKPDSPGALFIEYKINNHDKFVSAFKNSFSYERLTELEKANIKIRINFLLNKVGDILAIRFCLFQEDVITPFELEKLEKEFVNNLSFTPLMHLEEAFPSDYVVATDFKEITKGEIKKIRQREAKE